MSSATPEGDEPKLQIDSDWKAEAEAERERLKKQEEEAAAAGGSPGSSGAEGERGKLPPADFPGLMNMLASQAIMGLGVMSDPDSGGVMIDLETSRFAIDLLGVLEEKTKGNLTEEESADLTQVLSELRARYVQITQLVAQQMAAGGGIPGAAPGGVPGVGPGSRRTGRTRRSEPADHSLMTGRGDGPG